MIPREDCNISTKPSIDGVITGTTGNGIITKAEIDRVITSPTSNGIVTGQAINDVISSTTNKSVITCIVFCLSGSGVCIDFYFGVSFSTKI